MVLHEPGTSEYQLPRPAIRPYPVEYVKPWRTKTGSKVLIRHIRPEDETLIVAFHDRLSEKTVVRRYFTSLDLSARMKHERLTRICFIDYERELALVAVENDPAAGPVLGGVSRMIRQEIAARRLWP